MGLSGSSTGGSGRVDPVIAVAQATVIGPPDAARATAGLLLDRRRDPDSRWFVLGTRSRQEKALDQAVRGMGLSCWLPLRRASRRYGTRRVESLLPLFPGYLFLWGTRDEAYLADRTRRVAKLIEVPDQRSLEWELSNIHRALACEAPLDPYPALKEGVRVRVITGPFLGIEGVVRSRTAADRLLLQVRMLGTATSLDIHGEFVEPIEA
jgi:transcriptional antiterminator RfaH